MLKRTSPLPQKLRRMTFIEKFNLYDQQEIEPIDAKIDRVWKAIPGYNGLNKY